MEKQPSLAGKLWLVGAGPGDPDLLTLRAARLLASADLVVHDGLVGAGVLALIPPHVERISVAKQRSRHTMKQDLINALIVRETQSGKQVVRLKGGDPFIFGRGGEEVESLRTAGIEPVVINGITSGLAAITGLGAPLTHREHAQGVVFVTGHPQKNGPGLDWARLGASAHDLRLTLVIYMGISSAAHIQAGLLSALPGETPVAIIERASLPNQRQCITSLRELLPDLQGSGLGSPAIMVVGNVVRGVRALKNADPLAISSFHRS